MSRRNQSSAERLQSQLVDLSLNAPMVAATRLSRMALTGGAPSRRDQREFTRMGTEKVLAFYASWSAMWLEAAMMPWKIMSGTPIEDPACDIVGAGVKPIHKAAMANRRRLSRQRPRRR